MKKVSCILVAMLMVFCLVACGGEEIPTEEIKKELGGMWEHEFVNSFGNGHYSCYIFNPKNDKVGYVYDAIGFGSDYEKTGTYTIKKDVIECKWDDGKTTKLGYTYKDGKLTLSGDEEGGDKYTKSDVEITWQD